MNGSLYQENPARAMPSAQAAGSFCRRLSPSACGLGRQPALPAARFACLQGQALFANFTLPDRSERERRLVHRQAGAHGGGQGHLAHV